MICKNCGKESKDGAKFCTNCGTEIKYNSLTQNGANKVKDMTKEDITINSRYTKLGKKIRKIGLPVICILLLIVLLIPIYNQVQEHKYQSERDSFNEKFVYEGMYLISGAQLSDDQKYIENITFSPNNIDEFDSISKSDLLGSFSVYEAQVLWDSSHDVFSLSKGYGVGDIGMSFPYARGVVNKSIDTGKITIIISANDYWNGFAENKVYDFHSEFNEKVFDSFLRYINGEFVPVTSADMDYTDMNSVWIDDEMYLAESDGTDYWYDSEVLEIRNEW